jgi:hypothetical protein
MASGSPDNQPVKQPTRQELGVDDSVFIPRKDNGRIMALRPDHYTTAAATLKSDDNPRSAEQERGLHPETMRIRIYKGLELAF